jgi:hypothetical protein
MDPPIEYGVAVNFGNSNVGSGKIQPKKPVKSEPKKVEEQPKVEESQPEAAKPKEIKEAVITQDTEESIAIKKQKAAEAKALAEAKAEAERIAREKRIQEEKRKKLDALIGGVSKDNWMVILMHQVILAILEQEVVEKVMVWEVEEKQPSLKLFLIVKRKVVL